MSRCKAAWCRRNLHSAVPALFCTYAGLAEIHLVGRLRSMSRVAIWKWTSPEVLSSIWSALALPHSPWCGMAQLLPGRCQPWQRAALLELLSRCPSGLRVSQYSTDLTCCMTSECDLCIKWITASLLVGCVLPALAADSTEAAGSLHPSLHMTCNVG